MSANIGVTLGTTRLEVAAGGTVEIPLIVRNLSQIVDHYIISVEGLDPTWWNLSVPTFSLFPNDQGEARLSIHPPKEAEARAGGYSFRVKATSKADPQDFTTVEVMLILKGFIMWDVEMAPSKVTGKSGIYNLKINNLGNTDAVLVLEAKDAEEALSYQFSENPVTVPGGGSSRIRLDVKTKAKGIWQKQYNFQVNSRPSDSKGPREGKVINGTLEYPKKGFPWWILLIILGVILLLVGAGLIWYYFFSPAVNVTSPKGGESWTSGTTKNITWTTRSSDIKAVNIEMSKDGGLNWMMLKQNEANDGVWAWPISGFTTASGDCLVRISGLNQNNKMIARGISAGRFTISPPAVKPVITLTYPNSAVKLTGNSKINITWSVAGSGITYVTAYYSTNGGSTWTPIAQYQPNSLQMQWTVPNIDATTCKVKVTAYDASKVELSSDTSNTNFTIQKGSVLQIIDLIFPAQPFQKKP